MNATAVLNNGMDHIFVFRTNVVSSEEKTALLQKMLAELELEEASIDLEDCDKVLRIVTKKYSATELINNVNRYGFACAELE
jgi:hypothetical protein